MLLFEGPGYSGTYRNDWPGWYDEGHTVEATEGGQSMLTGQNGKRKAYDGAALVGVRFEDGAGNFVEYSLRARYRGMTLRQIVRACMGEDRENTGSEVWNQGHCIDVGSMVSKGGISDVTQNLRIGVGDGFADRDDWALFMLQNGNAQGDFSLQYNYAFGAKGRLNPGFNGQVFIHGVQHLAPGRGMWSTVPLPCTIDGQGCVLSPRFPLPYGDGERCVITVDPREAGPVRVLDFSTELRHDVLRVNGADYSGEVGPQGVVPTEPILWSSDHSVSSSGWRLCPWGAATSATAASVGGMAGSHGAVGEASAPSLAPALAAAATAVPLEPSSQEEGAGGRRPPVAGEAVAVAMERRGSFWQSAVTVALLLLIAGACWRLWCLASQRKRAAGTAASLVPEEGDSDEGRLLQGDVSPGSVSRGL